MRTSRISRETARVANALSSPSRRTTRNSLNSFGLASDSIKQEGIEDGGSLSSITPTRNGTTRAASSSLGKRKRTNGETSGSTNDSAAIPTSTRRSPRKAPKPSYSLNDSPDNDTPDDNDNQPKAKPRRKPAKHIKGPNSTTLRTSPPPHWEALYAATATMRSRIQAPVDTMGCESLAETHLSPRDQRLQTLVSLMLSSQTKDTVTAAAMANLQRNLPGGTFNLDALLKVSHEELNDLIAKVGFHNNKTKFIKSVAEILRDDYAGDIPDTLEGLISLPGVGPKMAYLCLSAAWGRDEGIGVDVHVHRITNLWKWHSTKNPEETRLTLESWLPREKWHEINHLLVGLGQTVCLPVGRRCGECDLSAKGMCPSAVKGASSSPVKRRVKKVEVEIEGANGEVVTKEEKVEVEVDDVGVKVEADVDGEKRVDVQSFVPVAPS